MAHEHLSSPEAVERRVSKIVILGFLSAVAPLSIDMYLPALPALSRDMHASASVAQLSLTACLIGLATGQLLAGPLSDARGRRIPLLAGTAIYTIASLLCASTNSIYVLIGLRLIQGLAGSAWIVIANAIVRDLYEGHKMTEFLALLMLVNGVAPIAAPILGGQILRFTSWHGVFIVLAALGGLMFISVLFGLKESLPPERRHTGGLRQTASTVSLLVRDKHFIGYALSLGFIFAAMFSYISGSPFVLQGIFGLSPQMFSVAFATNGLGIIIAGQVSARLSRRYGETKVLVGGLILAGVAGLTFLLMIATGASLVGVLPPLFFVVCCVGIVGPTATSLAMQEQGGRAGSAAAVMGLPQMLMGALAAPLVGMMGSGADLPLGIVIPICDLAAIASYLLLVRPSRIKRRHVA
ncbi:multidrug effflux MFS transporter [Alicyclobacillus ferrooxydans]|uniref:Bcr/CflA family efflux transporter n=1 Tax=Alicyclobacillus ferrooxydans TaxID=471514 RepID=A0A0P9C785_9BACL|nr:multidrug effflux MFS transporter [Alicyclobacillus ferrooxydans]KPV40760.1 MFS transporter [Alicyclobacillus ferrooxydans]